MQFVFKLFFICTSINILVVLLWTLILNGFNLKYLWAKYEEINLRAALNNLAARVTTDKPNHLLTCALHQNSCTFLVNGLGCSIPYYEPFHEDVRKYLSTSAITCKKTSFAFVRGSILRINKSALAAERGFAPDDIECVISSIKRYTKNDYRSYQIGVSPNFTDQYESKSHDFLRVACSHKDAVVYDDYFAFITTKPKLEKRCNEAWRKHRSDKTLKENLSVFLLGMDSMSHLNFLRKMPHSYEFLKHQMNAIELQGYTKLADNTFPCIVPLLFGKFERELVSPNGPYDHEPLLWKEFSQKGYRTLFAEDAPWISTFNHKSTGFIRQPADYYLRPLYLLAEVTEMRRGRANEHCFNSRLEVSVILDWLLEFLRTFREKPYFVYTFLTRLFHGLLNHPQNADPFLEKLLLQATSEGLLNNTVVIVFSDHGLRGGGFLSSPLGRYEARLPLFLMAFPKWFTKKYPKHYKNMQINQRRLTTLFDVREMLMDILNFRGTIANVSLSSRGISLFSEIPLERTCDNAAIERQWCMCNKYDLIPVEREDVIISALALVNKINSITAKERKKCAVLILQTVWSAQVYSADPEWSWLQVTIETTPGNGRFEGTVKYNTLTGECWPTAEFSRLNLYGNQSACVSYSNLRLFCYCV